MYSFFFGWAIFFYWRSRTTELFSFFVCVLCNSLTHLWHCIYTTKKERLMISFKKEKKEGRKECWSCKDARQNVYTIIKSSWFFSACRQFSYCNKLVHLVWTICGTLKINVTVWLYTGALWVLKRPTISLYLAKISPNSVAFCVLDK